MVHNGIEYAIMQLLTEVYDVLKRGLGLSNNRLHKYLKNGMKVNCSLIS